MKENENIPVSMILENLSDVPHYILPPGYKIRWYKPGDEKIWIRIQEISDPYNIVTNARFFKEFGKNLESLKERQLFICDPAGVEIGTSTAWFNNDYNGQIYGRVHWIAVVPEMQGKGLSKPLMTATLNRLRDLKYERCYLTTSTVRIPAINLYLKFGFVPEIKNDCDILAWHEVLVKTRKK